MDKRHLFVYKHIRLYYLLIYYTFHHERFDLYYKLYIKLVII